jgi:hypothetical protein
VKTGGVSADAEADMRAVVLRLLDDERSKIQEQAQQAQSDRISLLEKKVQRLAASLENAESERDTARERAAALEASGVIPLRNVYTAGLDAKDPLRERKLGLMKEICQFNRDIRQLLPPKSAAGPVRPRKRRLDRRAVRSGCPGAGRDVVGRGARRDAARQGSGIQRATLPSESKSASTPPELEAALEAAWTDTGDTSASAPSESEASPPLQGLAAADFAAGAPLESSQLGEPAELQTAAGAGGESERARARPGDGARRGS